MDRFQDLVALVAQFATEDGVHATAVPRLSLIRASRPTEPTHGLHQPALCIIAQGRKQVMVGDRVFIYDSATHLVVSVDTPVVGQVLDATPDEPYLCVRLDIQPAQVGALIMESGRVPNADAAPGPALSLSPVTTELLDAVIRLVGLLQHPADIPVLAPMIEREILYRLLSGDQAAKLHQIAVAESRLQHVNRAIGWIIRHYRQPFTIEAVAAEAGMSPSALHQHFKAVTAMSPLQYQKQLRLQEARRMMLSEAADAATAGHSVGYDSPSQFSREYARVFGAPPLRDVARLKASSEPLFAG